jgi:hypothetical protein
LPVTAYPPAPWTLGGWGVATVGLVDAAAAAEFVPDGAHLVQVAPRKTLGGLFLAYERGPLVYRELNVVAGLARVGTRLAFLLPRLYVDSPASLAGGHEIWGLPKELASFDIAHDIGVTSIEVRQGSRAICRLRCNVPTSGMRLPLPMPSFGVREREFLFFTGRLAARIALARATVAIDSESEFATLGLHKPRLSVRCDNLTLTVPPPRIVARVRERRAHAAV